MTDHRTGGNGGRPDSSQEAPGQLGRLSGSLEEQLARAQERLDFYEGFDRLIQDNIARSAELMREAMDLRERAQMEIAQARAEAERRVLTERERQRLVLTSLLDELAEVQQSAERVTRRVAQAMEEIGPGVSGGTTSGTIADTASGAAVVPPSGEGEEPFLVAAPGAGVEEPAPDAREQVTAPDGTWEEEVSAAALTVLEAPLTMDAPSEESAAATEPGAPADFSVAMPPAATATATEAPSALVAEPDATTPPASTAGPVDSGPDEGTCVVMVLVHGVPRAAAALSLQRHLASLQHVDGVEAREYAEGILRLQVTARRPLNVQDLQTWDGATGMEPVHVQADVIEVKLPGAETF